MTYLFVVNITNYSNTTVYIDDLTVSAASSYINTTNTKSTFSQVSSGVFLSQQLAFIRYSSPYDGLDYLSPYESELVAISGITKVSNTTTLQSGTFFLGGNMDGSIDDWHSGWGGSQKIQVQNFGNEYLYNNLLSSNQTLHIQVNAVYIGQES